MYIIVWWNFLLSLITPPALQLQRCTREKERETKFQIVRLSPRSFFFSSSYFTHTCSLILILMSSLYFISLRTFIVTELLVFLYFVRTVHSTLSSCVCVCVCILDGLSDSLPSPRLLAFQRSRRRITNSIFFFRFFLFLIPFYTTKQLEDSLA